jgi:hypothetical protein
MVLVGETDWLGAPLPGARITAVELANGHELAAGEADDTGRFRLTLRERAALLPAPGRGLPPGRTEGAAPGVVLLTARLGDRTLQRAVFLTGGYALAQADGRNLALDVVTTLVYRTVARRLEAAARALGAEADEARARELAETIGGLTAKLVTVLSEDEVARIADALDESVVPPLTELLPPSAADLLTAGLAAAGSAPPGDADAAVPAGSPAPSVAPLPSGAPSAPPGGAGGGGAGAVVTEPEVEPDGKASVGLVVEEGRLVPVSATETIRVGVP